MKHRYNRYLLYILAILSLNFADSQPIINTVSPEQVFAGDIITITGSQFLAISQIKIGYGNFEPTALIFYDDNTIVMPIPTSFSSGTYNLILKSGSVSGNNFNLSISGPSITSISPQAQEIDYRITISTNRIDSVYGVSLGGNQADLSTINYINGGSEFSIILPYVNKIGLYPLKIATKHDITPAFQFSVSGLNIPKIIAINPISATSGSIINISGLNLISVTGISFGTTIAPQSSIVINSNQDLNVEVPFLGVGENKIKVYSNRGVSNEIDFKVVSTQPNIDTFMPQMANIGDEVTVFGSNLGNTIAVVINNTTTNGIKLISINEISFIVPNEARTGLLSLVSIYNKTTSTTILEVNTVTSIRTKVNNLDGATIDDIKIVYNQNNILSLEMLSQFSKLIISDLMGKNLFEANNLPIGKIEIPGISKVGFLIVQLENKYSVFREKILINP